MAKRVREDPPLLSPTTTSMTMALEESVPPSNNETNMTTTKTTTIPGTLTRTSTTTTELETIHIQVVFETIAPQPSSSTSSMVLLMLLDAQHISILERLTRDYLRLQGNLDVQELSVLHQEIAEIAGSSTFQLTVYLSVTGYDVQWHVIQALNDDWSGYVAFLRIGLDDVILEAVDKDTNTTIVPAASSAASSSAIGDTKDWKLLGMALLLSLLAVASVIVVRRAGRRRLRLWYKGHKYYRDDTDSSNLDNHDAAVDTSNSGGAGAGAGDKRAGGAQYYRNDDSSLSMSEILEYIVDDNDAHDNDNDVDEDADRARERALSEESDSGWQSALSSMQDGGTTLSSIHEGGVEDFDFDDNDVYEHYNGYAGDADEDTENPSSVVPPVSDDEECWAYSSDRQVKGVLIYV
jgi:hypothetical protein